MITIYTSESRSHADHGWLDTYHTFSFNTYHNRDRMRFRSLRVINEDRVAPRMGIGTIIRHQIDHDRHAWIQLMRGSIAVADHELTAGDGAAISEESLLVICASSDAELLLFDLA